MERKHVIVVGGGITGLTTAYYIQKQARENDCPVSVSLIEGGSRLGGKIQTERIDGFVIEKGPDSFLARKPAIIDLTKELGLDNELVGTNPKARKNYILHRNRLHLMPPGLILGIPTQLAPFVKTGLISPWGKLRAGMDLFIPARTEEGDESLGSFLQRRLGREVAENIAEPLLSGIYAGDTQALSLNATFPQFKAVERKYGSIIKGMLYSRKAASSSAPQPPLQLPPAAKESMFLTYQHGLETLVQRLESALDSVDIHMNESIKDIQCEAGRYKARLESGKEMTADSLVLATPAYATREILKDLETAAYLDEIPYVSVANVALAFNRHEMDYPMDASGFVVPRREGRSITACTWTSSKWPTTTPKDKVLLRCYVGHARDQTSAERTDEEVLQMVSKDMEELMGVTAEPIFYRITRWKKSMPQYRVGHLDRLAKLRNDLTAMRPGIFLAGAGYEGVGIPDCIQQGKKAAQDAIEYINKVKGLN